MKLFARTLDAIYQVLLKGDIMGQLVFVFPGQGAQEVGMGEDIYEKSQKAKQLIDEAAQCLDFDLKEICFTENSLLNDTAYTQPALLSISIALFELVKELGIVPDYVAGLSLGEYSALVAAEVITYKEAVSIVRQRGLLMQQAAKEKEGGMAAILNATKDEILEICQKVEGILEIANYNNAKQIVVSGEKKALEEGLVLFKEAGIKAIPLQVSGAFHSSLMASASEGLRQVLAPIVLCEPKMPYVTNVTAQVVNDSQTVKELLVTQVQASVRWDESIEKLIELGADTFIEIGPGKTLAGLIKKINRQVKVINVSNFSDVEALKGQLGLE